MFQLAKNLYFYARTKHIEIDYHFIREHIKSMKIIIHHITTQHQIVDIFTMSLSTIRFFTLLKQAYHLASFNDLA